MSYWIHQCGNKNNSLWRFFMCDHRTDLKNLPTASKEGEIQPNDTVCKNKCCPGSQCFCIEDSSTWVLGKDNDKWTETEKSSSGSSPGATTNIKPITESQIYSLF